MPHSTVVFYKDDDGTSPVLNWLHELQQKNQDAFGNCAAVIENLERHGHELRRPIAATLDDGIMELRTKHQHVQYRILYFFNGKDFAVLAHAIVKKGSAVPSEDIKRAVKRKKIFQADPKKHTWEGDDDA